MNALPIVLALIVGAAVGGGLGLYFAAVAKDAGEKALETFAARQLDVIRSHEKTIAGLLESNRELAHKVSQPEQAGLDHMFERERARRAQEKDREQRKKVAAEIDKELAARGISIE